MKIEKWKYIVIALLAVATMLSRQMWVWVHSHPEAYSSYYDVDLGARVSAFDNWFGSSIAAWFSVAIVAGAYWFCIMNWFFTRGYFMRNKKALLMMCSLGILMLFIP